MELTLLGTGGPAGLPRPGCPCATCAAAVGSAARAPTALLVDQAVLVDLLPGAAFAAARAGRSLHGVRQVLLSRPPDGPTPQVPAGLPAPVRLAEGQEVALLGGHRIRAVPVDSPGTGYEITGPDGTRLLLLPPAAAAAEHGTHSARRARGHRDAHPYAPYDAVLLDAVSRPDALAGLRAAGAVTAGTDVVAVHLGHDAPPGNELGRRLAAAGARAEPDGAAFVVGEHHPLPVPRRTLVLGGARSGKSAEAERRLAAFPRVQYVATGGTREEDPEWAARIAAHRARRPEGWRTVETCDLAPLLATDDEAPLLIDCLALWLTDAMDSADAWDEAAWSTGGGPALAERTAALVAAVRSTSRTVVAVSNEVGSGVVPGTRAGRRFRDELGRLNAAVAAECEQVLLVVAGMAQQLKGG